MFNKTDEARLRFLDDQDEEQNNTGGIYNYAKNTLISLGAYLRYFFGFYR